MLAKVLKCSGKARLQAGFRNVPFFHYFWEVELLLLTSGQTRPAALEGLIDTFGKRINHYIPFRMECTADLKLKGKTDSERMRQREGEALLRFIKPQDMVWLFDEKGKTFDSRGFAARLQKAMNAGPKRIVLVIGGAYGFSPEVRARADGSISLSEMTFNHQVVRLMAVEQLYRAFSILRGEPYHND